MLSLSSERSSVSKMSVYNLMHQNGRQTCESRFFIFFLSLYLLFEVKDESKSSFQQSVSSGLPSTPDIFDFPDDRSVGSGSSYPSPSPHGNPFAFGSSPNARGGAATGKRRPRQRKAVNMGDRTASTDSLGGAPEPIKRPRREYF